MLLVIMNVFIVLKKHKNEITSKYNVKRIGIFGSYAKGQQNTESDIDVLVELKKPTFDNFMELSFYLEDLSAEKLIFSLLKVKVLICDHLFKRGSLV